MTAGIAPCERDSDDRTVKVKDVISLMELSLPWKVADLESLEMFTTISTFLCGFIVNDFVSFDFSSWPDHALAEIYLILMAVPVGNTIFCSVLGVFVIMACKRVRGIDELYLRRLQELVESGRTEVAHKELLNLWEDDPSDGINPLLGQLDPAVRAATSMRSSSFWTFPHLRPGSMRISSMQSSMLQEGCCAMIMDAAVYSGPLGKIGMKQFPVAVLLYVIAVVLSVQRNHLVPWHFEPGDDLEPWLDGWPSMIALPVIIWAYYCIPVVFLVARLTSVFGF